MAGRAAATALQDHVNSMEEAEDEAEETDRVKVRRLKMKPVRTAQQNVSTQRMTRSTRFITTSATPTIQAAFTVILTG